MKAVAGTGASALSRQGQEQLLAAGAIPSLFRALNNCITIARVKKERKKGGNKNRQRKKKERKERKQKGKRKKKKERVKRKIE